MNRRDVLEAMAAGAVVAGTAGPLAASAASKSLQAPAKEKVKVAFLLAQDAQMIDFAGPWEVFQDVHVPSRGASMDAMMPFQLFTVAESTQPLQATGGMKIIPDYSYADAPQAHVIVVPAQRIASEPTRQWLRHASVKTDVTMSVCTGAFVLGAAGLLDGLSATTHFSAYDEFARVFPRVKLQRGVRFVENEKISTSAGLSAGIDLALHVVERYFGRDVAAHTAKHMEYESDGWKV